MNLHETIQKQLAEFEKLGDYHGEGDEEVYDPPTMRECKQFIEKALTESLKEAFADGRADMKNEAILILAGLKNKSNNAIMTTLREGENTGIKKAIAALQAIEEKVKAYFQKP